MDMPSIVTGREVVYAGTDAGRWEYGVMGMFGHFSVDSIFQENGKLSHQLRVRMHKEMLKEKKKSE